MELQYVTCIFVGADEPMAIATFANYGAEHRWIADGGSPDSPDPHYQGCCVQGNLWAATADFNQLKASEGYWSSLDPTAVEFSEIIYALGGKQVNSTAVSH